MDEHKYRVVVSTRLFPDVVWYPGTGERLYTRAGAVEMMERLVHMGHRSDYETGYGCWAECPGERFTLADMEAES